MARLRCLLFYVELAIRRRILYETRPGWKHGPRDFFSSSRLMLSLTILQRDTRVNKNVQRLAIANLIFWNGFKVESTTRCWLPKENTVSGICSSVSERMHGSHCARNLYLILRMKNAIRVCVVRKARSDLWIQVEGRVTPKPERGERGCLVI